MSVIFRQNFKQAISDFSKAIELNQNGEEAYFNRGITYSLSGNKDKALEDYTKVIEINPNHIDAIYFRANIYVLKQEYELAISDYEKLREYDKAIYYFTKAIQINLNNNISDNPLSNIVVYAERGNCYFKKLDYKNCIEDLKKKCQINERI